ncbi:D-alanyl-D-alanine carboxypeptidase family protein [Kitasatospora sp. NBC_01266]|uniref:D-alanyl-D-alanine carboxypeptidase family protein n=1 Tax=Kitasatospora sp. NBC_01266 TaxID=2903572 RepID=UPI002E36475F|nr:serine hydrolase [Kitasatospora sp. NBC_01266]
MRLIPGLAARRPRAVLQVAAAVAIACATVVASTLVPSGAGRTPPAIVFAPDAAAAQALPGWAALPWPDQGQSSVVVEGVGSLGTRGEQRPVPIASVTKVMTAYVVLEDHPLGSREDEGPTITVDQQAADESHSKEESTAPVRAGQQLTERQLLLLMMLPSGNNIARLLARWDAGSEQAFVAKMNDRARSLGMRNTSYTGASGIQSDTTSTSDDQLVLARQAMAVPALAAVVGTESTTVPGVPGTVRNTNTLVGRDGVVGLKTGSSTPAGGALVWAAQASTSSGPRLVIGVVLQQDAGQPPAEGLRTVLRVSHKLITAIQDGLR